VLGYFNVNAMLESAQSSMLTEWMAFTRLNPIGECRADLRMGILARTFAESYRDTKSHPKPFMPSDFIPDFIAAHKKKLTPRVQQKDMKQKVLALAEALGAKVVKRDPK